MLQWVRRDAAGTQPLSWRPVEQYRKAVSRLLLHLDAQFASATGHVGLQHFQFDATAQLWKQANWRRWPSINEGIEMGSSNLSAMHPLEYHFSVQQHLCLRLSWRLLEGFLVFFLFQYRTFLKRC